MFTIYNVKAKKHIVEKQTQKPITFVSINSAETYLSFLIEDDFHVSREMFVITPTFVHPQQSS